MTQGYFEDYIRKYIEAEQNKRNSPYQNFKNTVNNVLKTGNNMTTAGDFMKNNLNNPTLQNIGSNISNAGAKLTNGANKINSLTSPQNYFKGFAPRPFSAIAPTTTVGSSLGGSAIGNAIGSEVAGTAAGTGAVGSAIAEAAPMATAGSLGAGTAAGTAAAAGGAAGGAAAGGSAATGAAMSNPVTALAALAVMAAMGANRKRAKKSGEALMNSTNEMVNNGSEEALNQTNQFAKDSIGQDYTQNMLPTNYDGMTGAAAQLSPIEEYQNALRAQGYSDDVINGIPQGLNSGYKEIDEWIKQYNEGSGRNNPINIPQTEEEIAAAKAGNFNVPTQNGSAEATEQVKRGLLDKFLSGIGDLASGYQENRNNGFKPSNLQRRMDVQEFKNSINPDDYTTKLNKEEQAQFDKWVGDMKAKEIINPNDNFNDYDMQGYWKNEVLKNTNLANGNAQTHFTDKYKKPNHETFSNESIYAKGDNAKYAGKWNDNEFIAPRNENKMTRIGEVLGTIGRVAQNPTVQGLVAGGLSTALTGNPLYGLGQGYKFANNRAMSNIYGDILKQYGVDVPETGLFGNISSGDMRNIGNMAETHAWHEYMNKRYADELAAKIAKNEADKQYKEDRIEVLKQNADTNAYKAKNGTKVTHVGSGKKSSGGSAKTTYQLVNGKDGNVYRLNKATGEYRIVGSKTGNSFGGGKDIVTANKTGAETEDEFKNRVFGNKKSNSNQGWAF